MGQPRTVWPGERTLSVLLDDGMSCAAIAKVLLLDDDTIRTWHRLYEEDGIEGLGPEPGQPNWKKRIWRAARTQRTNPKLGVMCRLERLS